MKKDRRSFLKLTGAAGICMAGNKLLGSNTDQPVQYQNDTSASLIPDINDDTSAYGPADPGTSLIGSYGPWAAGLTGKVLPSFSFRRKEWKKIETWRKATRKRLAERLAIPDTGVRPEVTAVKKYSYDGLDIEELEWQLPYGRKTEAILLKPQNATGKLPGILAFHDHGGNKYFGNRKITKTSDNQHPMMVSHQESYYEGNAWANEIARRGYVVLVADAFAFASRRVMMQDIPVSQKQNMNDNNPEDPENIANYNRWASQHEHIMAKSLFSAGTTWPGVFLAEDIKALDILCSRADVDENRIGCAGLSGGGLRTVLAGGFDPRIKCAVCVGFMTTWKDFLLNKSFTHTWMTYVPLLPKELDFPEILGLRVPMPALVLNNNEDALFTLDEMKQADKILRDVYEKAGAGNNYKCSYYPGPHKFDAGMQKEAFEWFDKWLA